MKNNSNKPFDDERFSNDPEENLRIENEILRLKLKAELGGIYENNIAIPPGLENEFLKSVLAFEHRYAHAKSIKLHELLGYPVCRPEKDMDDEAVVTAFRQLEELMEHKAVVVEFHRARDVRFKYKFITEELFDYETDDMQMPGMTRHFIYEEFHPDHELEIESRAKEFLSAWLERSVRTEGWYLGESFIQPDGIILSKEELLAKLSSVFDAYIAFENGNYKIDIINFELRQEGPQEGLGFAEGTIRYDAILESGERKKIEGPFKIYFSRDEGWWNIVFFYLAGFNIS